MCVQRFLYFVNLLYIFVQIEMTFFIWNRWKFYGGRKNHKEDRNDGFSCAYGVNSILLFMKQHTLFQLENEENSQETRTHTHTVETLKFTLVYNVMCMFIVGTFFFRNSKCDLTHNWEYTASATFCFMSNWLHSLSIYNVLLYIYFIHERMRLQMHGFYYHKWNTPTNKCAAQSKPNEKRQKWTTQTCLLWLISMQLMAVCCCFFLLLWQFIVF